MPRFLLLIFIMMASVITRANHIYGGNMSLQATQAHNKYTVSLTLFFDKRNADPTSGYESPLVYIFRKSDNKQVRSILLSPQQQQDLFNSAALCAYLLPLSILSIQYSAVIELTPQEYSDSKGYYIIWERCCRNQDIANINKPSNTGMVFRLDFPALGQTNSAVANSSPEFSIPPADYICINKPYRISFKATDSDGDRLQYELVDPLAGYTSEFPESNRIGTGESRTFYPPVSWNSGFTATNAINGNPTLQINATTGELTVTATQIGLYAFAVLVREFRNGIELGQVRREFQLPVVDCRQNQLLTTPPLIRVDGQTGAAHQNCEDNPITMSIPIEQGFHYQWQRNGKDLDGQTQSSITVTKGGNYTVVKRFAQDCGRDTVSNEVVVYCDTQLWIPTCFTPNGDGVNDVWKISPTVQVDDLQVIIYDRWGSVVYSENRYSKPWDGTSQNQRVPSGIYTYLVKVPNKETYRGSLWVLY